MRLVCENHPTKAWPDECDCGPGMNDPVRVKLIKDAWKRYKNRWPKGAPLFRVPAEDWKTAPLTVEETVVPEQTVEVLTFRIESGHQDGEPARRVVCEGVVLDVMYAT